MSPSKTPTRPAGDVVSVRIELVDSDPLIWREVEIPTDITLTTLHHIVQAAMGWFDYHLWEFRVGGKAYGLPMDEDWGTEPREEAAKTRLVDVLKGGRTVIGYTYDMGDDWAHKLVVSNRRPADAQVAYPRFVAGQNACPPEDCGGLPGFYWLLDARGDPQHPDHAEAMEQLGDYAPDEIDELSIALGLGRLGKAHRKDKTSR